MGQILIIIVVIAIVYFVFFKKKPNKNIEENEDIKKNSSDMVECATCGAYAEVNESILSLNKYYCSDECVSKS